MSDLKDFKPNTGATVPSSNVGASDDTVGQVAFDSGYIYYCYRKPPRTTNYSVTVKENVTGNSFKANMAFADFPDDIYDGFTVHNASDVQLGSIAGNIGNVGGNPYITYSGSDSHTAGEVYTLKPGSSSIWKRTALSTW